ncbi:response regulator [Alicyclobacillus ferrooxydans]|uniref:Transcriptional regulatory protein n=1 Tax=Alicyclobacillus ferrooxydans TaxID=471514 RepID=A0A0P9CQD2_9BACL|nr:response regulator [Alicyclobacillus ferrooxydans]KPV45111.1 hypothetical protein AN477_03755 [Alicyclobacillus ferrooxydans]
MAGRRDLSVIVVEDDFRINQIHQRYVSSVDGFTVVGTAKTAAETLRLLQQCEPYTPDLLLLDVYLPDHSGVELLSEIRSLKYSCDVIMVTAAKELDVVETGFRQGIFDYLVKPFTLDTLGVTLRKYAQYKAQLEASGPVDQAVIDSLKKIRATQLVKHPSQESGIDERTLERIAQTLSALESARTADEIAREAGVSRSTARTYLDYMVEKGLAEEWLSYGSVGRPRRMFQKPSRL